MVFVKMVFPYISTIDFNKTKDKQYNKKKY